jgi:transcription-repair coupling factor (superfamily II helicase)
MQVLADLVTEERKAKTAIVATVGSLQPHLPPPAEFKSFCLKLKPETELNLETFGSKITTLGYERVPLVAAILK